MFLKSGQRRETVKSCDLFVFTSGTFKLLTGTCVLASDAKVSRSKCDGIFGGKQF